jgi:hypothetical protein
MRADIEASLRRGTPTIGLAWQVAEQLLPPGWDICSLTRQGVGNDRMWTVKAAPVTSAAFGRLRSLGHKGGPGTVGARIQTQDHLVSVALLRLALQCDELPDALWIKQDRSRLPSEAVLA